VGKRVFGGAAFGRENRILMVSRESNYARWGDVKNEGTGTDTNSAMGWKQGKLERTNS